VVRGRGIGLGTHHVSYGAAVADIEVNRRTGVIVATHLYGALDCGLAVNPALVETQIIGQMIQSVSRVLKEEVLFDQRGVTSLDWESYPVLRFAEHPAVTPVVVQRIDEPDASLAFRISLNFEPAVSIFERPARASADVRELSLMPLSHVRLGDLTANCEAGCDERALRYGVLIAAGRLGAPDVVGVRCFSAARGNSCVGTLAAPERDE